MKKLLILSVVLLTMTLPLFAADFSIGPKAVLGEYSYRGSDWKETKDSLAIKDKFSLSYGGGLMFNMGLTEMFSVQLDALYLFSTVRVGNDSVWAQNNYSSVNLPLYARFDFPVGSVNLYLMGGPSFTILFDKYKTKDNNGNTTENTLSDDEKNFLIGISAGAGVAVPAGPGNLDIGAVYNTNFTKINPNNSTYFQGFEFQVGYGFKL